MSTHILKIRNNNNEDLEIGDLVEFFHKDDIFCKKGISGSIREDGIIAEFESIYWAILDDCETRRVNTNLMYKITD